MTERTGIALECLKDDDPRVMVRGCRSSRYGFIEFRVPYSYLELTEADARNIARGLIVCADAVFGREKGGS